jgi:hypothetical protein
MSDNISAICITLAFIALIGSITFYHYNELQVIKSNVESAIVKGIDPIAVRCAYANERDTICVSYAASASRITPQPVR